MKAAMNQIYGETKANEFFSLADYFRQEGREKGKKEGKKESDNLWTKSIKEAQARGILDHKAVQVLLQNIKGKD